MKYKAVFFDRDGTLTYQNPVKEAWFIRQVEAWSGRSFTLSYEKMMELFGEASKGRKPWYRNVEEEKQFFQRYYWYLLKREGVEEEVEERANLLFSELWLNHDRCLFEETEEVLSYFAQHGYRLGVISDSAPSLELSLQALGIGHYFSSFTASSIVGAGKPSPIIFRAALESLGVTAEESIYVDDYKPEADGARELGFTSFWLDRTGEDHDLWTIHSLKELTLYAESANDTSQG